ncbi:glycosyltransferase [Parasediminibacterium sp. JCM 36343]|uniref:glycosyltransferase family protein n=1 Tax=Parasediminibacterium sp. JCM 36343 TaxID=3374279 RepID=UPI00397B9F35
MTIYLAFFQALKKHNIPAYSFWEYYIKNGIEEAGHHWVESKVDWAELHTYASTEKESIEQWKANTWQVVLDDIRKHQSETPIDIFLSYFYPNHIDELAIKEIQKLGIKCVNFFCDNIRDFTKIPNEFKIFDLNWVPEYKALKMYKQANMPFIHLPMPMWVNQGLRQISTAENNQVSFIGSKDAQRAFLFSELSKKNITFDLYGAGWLEGERSSMPSTKQNVINNQLSFIIKNGFIPFFRKINRFGLPKIDESVLANHLKPKPSFDEYVQITKQSMVTLGVNRYPSFHYPFLKPNTYSRLRDIEAPMLGACYLTEYTEGLENMYDIGQEIEVYKSVDELVAKIELLSADTNKRKQIRAKGQKKALAAHSIVNSINKIKQYFE